jgi:hypothetical protein
MRITVAGQRLAAKASEGKVQQCNHCIAAAKNSNTVLRHNAALQNMVHITDSEQRLHKVPWAVAMASSSCMQGHKGHHAQVFSRVAELNLAAVGELEILGLAWSSNRTSHKPISNFNR